MHAYMLTVNSGTPEAISTVVGKNITYNPEKNTVGTRHPWGWMWERVLCKNNRKRLILLVVPIGSFRTRWDEFRHSWYNLTAPLALLGMRMARGDVY